MKMMRATFNLVYCLLFVVGCGRTTPTPKTTQSVPKVETPPPRQSNRVMEGFEKFAADVRRRGGQMYKSMMSADAPVRIVSFGDQFDDEDVRSLLPFGAIQTIVLKGEQFTDSTMSTIAELREVGDLNLVACNLTETGVKKLSKLKLEGLTFHEMNVTDAMLDSVGSIGTLRALVLRDCQTSSPGFLIHLNCEQLTVFGLGQMEVDDVGLTMLEKCRDLVTLHLRIVENSKSALQAIQNLDRLAHLEIEECELPDDFLDLLSKLKSLQSADLTRLELAATPSTPTQNIDQSTSSFASPLNRVKIYDCELIHGFLSELSKFESLETVVLIASDPTDTDLQQLVGSNSITRLEIRGGSRITDDALSLLISMKSLKSLYLLETSVSEAGKSRFEEARPDVNVECEWLKVNEGDQRKRERSVD